MTYIWKCRALSQGLTLSNTFCAFDRLGTFPEGPIDIKAAWIVGMALPLNRRHAIMWTKND